MSPAAPAMSVAAALAAGDLGPVTEARFAAAFAAGAVITRKAAAGLIGLDVKTLDVLVEQGLIRTVRRGKLAAFIERDLRAFLSPEASPCPSIAPPAPASGNTISSSRVVAFSARPARLRVVRPKP